jgi:hypothetical protein
VPRISYSKYSSSLPLVRFFDYLIPCSFDSRHSPLFIRSLWCNYDAHLCSGMNRRAGESLSLISHSHIIWHPLTGPLVSILGIPLYMVPLHLLGCTHLVLIHMPAQQWVPSSSPTFSLFPHCSHCLMARVLIYPSCTYILTCFYWPGHQGRASCMSTIISHSHFRGVGGALAGL